MIFSESASKKTSDYNAYCGLKDTSKFNIGGESVCYDLPLIADSLIPINLLTSHCSHDFFCERRHYP